MSFKRFGSGSGPAELSDKPPCPARDQQEEDERCPG